MLHKKVVEENMAEVDLQKISLYSQTELFYAKKLSTVTFGSFSFRILFLARISVNLTHAQTFFRSVFKEYKIMFDILCF
jgi:hypothetical protein